MVTRMCVCVCVGEGKGTKEGEAEVGEGVRLGGASGSHSSKTCLKCRRYRHALTYKHTRTETHTCARAHQLTQLFSAHFASVRHVYDTHTHTHTHTHARARPLPSSQRLTPCFLLAGICVAG